MGKNHVSGLWSRFLGWCLAPVCPPGDFVVSVGRARYYLCDGTLRDRLVEEGKADDWGV